MSAEINVHAELNCLFLCCAGIYSVADHIRLYQTAVDSALQYERFNILIDVNSFIGNPSISDRFEAGEFLANQIREKAPGKIRIALVGQEPFIYPRGFGEIVLTNRGVNGKFFSKLNEAIEWLNQSAGDNLEQTKSTF